MSEFKIIQEVGLDPESFDKKKLLRQIELYESWRLNCGAKGYIEACTGFGKTFCLILAILRMNRYDSNLYTNVIVPSMKLEQDWTGENGHIEKFGLKSVKVFVVNTYTMSTLPSSYYSCHLLGLDECHHYANEENRNFHKVLALTTTKAIIGLSATLSKKHQEFFLSHGLKSAGVVTKEEAEREGFISKSYIFNLAVQMTEEDKIAYQKITNVFNSNFAKFEHNWSLVQACRVGKDKATWVEIVKGETRIKAKKTGQEWKEYWAKETGWKIEDVSKAAQLFGWAMQERQDFLHNLNSKVQLAKKIIDKFNVPTIVFSESTKFADNIELLMEGKARAYHSNLKTIIRDGKKFGKEKRKKEAIELFKKGKIKALLTARALNEGLDIPSIELAIIGSGKAVPLHDTQRTGRATRFVIGKTAIIVNLYVEDYVMDKKKVISQDKKWLMARQKGVKNVTWIKSIEEICPKEIETISFI